MKAIPGNEKWGPAIVSDSTERLSTKTCATAEAWGRKSHSYKPLPIRFRKDGFSYRQIASNDNAAIYEQTWRGCPNPSICYEVIRIRRREGFHIGPRFIEPAEVFPNSESWGLDGFTFTDKDPAFAKLRLLGARQ